MDEDDSYGDEYSQSLEERVKVESEESSLEDEDFNFLTSEKFFEQMIMLKLPSSGGEIVPAKSIK